MSYKNLSQDIQYQKYLSRETTTSDVELKELRQYNDRFDGNYIIDPFDNEEYSVEYDLYTDDIDQEFAYLVIDKLDIKKPIYLDASDEHLAMGLGHIYGTSLPIGGKDQRSVIAGHRGWYKDVMFLNLHKLDVGDEMKIIRDGGEMIYTVSDFEVIYPDEWEKLQPRRGEDMITLLTCEPLAPPRPQRLLVNGTRVVEEVKPVQEQQSQVIIKDSDQIDQSIRNQNLIIFGITAVLMIALLMAVYKFVKYIKN